MRVTRLPPIIYTSPENERTVGIRIRRVEVRQLVDRPIVLRIGSIAVWYDGETIRIARARV